MDAIKHLAAHNPQARQAGAPTGTAPPLVSNWRRTFLICLAETSNIRLASARAGVSPSTAYDLRRRDPDFAAKWADALCDGYDNLEMEMLYRLRSGDLPGDPKFNYPVAFAEDRLEIAGAAFAAGEAPSVPVVEIREAV